jgi:hypothetical protein
MFIIRSGNNLPRILPLFAIEDQTKMDRVGGGFTAPTSHTTVRAVRHTAVRERF